MSVSDLDSSEVMLAQTDNGANRSELGINHKKFTTNKNVIKNLIDFIY